ncbi:MAG: hypothetical protein AAB225_02680 [Acidobacteriota bacterium]
MPDTPNAGRAEVAECVRRSLHQILDVKGRKPAIPVPDSTVLIGAPDALLDSLGLVMFLAELERELQRRWGASVDLFGGAGLLDQDDGPETLRTLGDRILGLLNGERGAPAAPAGRDLE